MNRTLLASTLFAGLSILICAGFQAKPSQPPDPKERREMFVNALRQAFNCGQLRQAVQDARDDGAVQQPSDLIPMEDAYWKRNCDAVEVAIGIEPTFKGKGK